MKRIQATMAAVALLALAVAGHAVPTIQHDPVRVAEKGKPLGVRAAVRDASARIESVSLFYATTRGATPFRAAMSSTGAGTWYATIPGHLIGPGPQLLYYVQAENADGETAETDWNTVRVVETGISPEAIPSASEVARNAQRQAVPASSSAPAPAPAAKPARNRYLVPAAIIAGGAVAIGGAYAITEGGGGGGGNGDAVTNANYGGNYDICFESTAESNATTTCDGGLVNVYVKNGGVEVVGLWGSEIFAAGLGGNVFSVAKNVPSTSKFPQSYIILSGEIRGESCAVEVNGYSRDPANPGNYSGRIEATKR